MDDEDDELDALWLDQFERDFEWAWLDDALSEGYTDYDEVVRRVEEGLGGR